WQGGARWRRAIEGVCRPTQEADGGKGDGTAGMEKAAVADLHETVRKDMREEPAEKFHDIKGRGAEADTAPFTVGEAARAVLQADETVVGDGDLADIGGEGGEGGRAVVIGLTMDMPGDGPDLGIDVLQPCGLAQLFFEERTGDGGEGFDGDKEV